MARFDDDFEFIGIVGEKNRINSTSLGNYFNLRKGRSVDLEAVQANMKGLKYTLSAENYIFGKLT